MSTPHENPSQTFAGKVGHAAASMSVAARFASFAVVLGLAFAGAVAAGEAIDPDRGGDAPAHAEGEATTGAHGGGSSGGAPEAIEQQAVRGLAVAGNGVRLVVENPDFERGRSERLTYRVVDREGRTVRDFDVAHTKRMHLIVARRDLTGFQHLHPRQAADGSWSTSVRLDDAGSYRLFADFTRDGRAATLASDLRVDGDADLKALPAPAAKAISDLGDEVMLQRQGNELSFVIRRDGKRVRTQPYLGASGHLVALREGDLAFLHVHPREHGDAGPVAFETEFPTAARYRLFLQFKRGGRVDTVAFTQDVR